MFPDPPSIDLNADVAALPPQDCTLDRRDAFLDESSGADLEAVSEKLMSSDLRSGEEGVGVEASGVWSSVSASNEYRGDAAVPSGIVEEGPALEEDRVDSGAVVLCGGGEEEFENLTERPVIYEFSCEERLQFSSMDLVWGKVKSHPWWPGLIFDPVHASELALRHQRRKDSLLVAYFRDRTFAWCDKSQLKNLWVDFSAMEMQSGSEAFAEAVLYALAEVSRRVESGLACFCTDKETCSRLKFAGIENSGIKKGVEVSEISWNFGCSFFQPAKLLEYLQSLAVSSTSAVDRLSLTVARSQLMAYYRFKGFENLRDIFFGKGLEDSSEVCSFENMTQHWTPVTVANERLSALASKRAYHKSGSGPQYKRKSASEDGGKVKRISDLMGNSEGGTRFHKRLKVVASSPDNPSKSELRSVGFVEDQEVKSPSPVPYKSFRVGECIRRVASKLTSMPPVKTNGAMTQINKERKDVKEDNPFSLENAIPSPEQMENSDMNIPNCTSFDELHFQLCLAASDPMTTHGFASIVLGFFTGFLRFRALSSCIFMPDKYGYKLDGEDLVSSPVSNEHTKTPDEVIHQRKQVPFSKEYIEAPKEVKRKRGRPRLNHREEAEQPQEVGDRQGRMDSRLTEVAKPPKETLSRRDQPSLNSEECNKPSGETRSKRGRPWSRPAIDMNTPEIVKRKRGRPPSGLCKVMKTPEELKRKRGRPPSRLAKVDADPETAVYGTDGDTLIPVSELSTSTPAYMNDSYWTDVVICSTPGKRLLTVEKKRRGRRKKQYLLKMPEDTENPPGETTESKIQKSTIDASVQIQIPAVSVNTHCSLMPERRITYLADKCVEESNPTALILNFINPNSLPLETELVRVFSRYGPLMDAETEVQKHSSLAKIVFKRRADAELAFTNARKYNFFGHALLSFRLRNLPSIPENSSKTTFERKNVQALVCSSTPSQSVTRDSETVMTDCAGKVEDAKRQMLLDCTQENLSEKNHSDMGQFVVEVEGEEGRKMFSYGDKVLSSDAYETVLRLRNLDIADTKLCMASTNTSLEDIQGQQEDDTPTGDAKSQDFSGQQEDAASRKDAKLEDSIVAGDGVCASVQGKAIVGNNDVPSSQNDFDATIPGAGDVESCINRANVTEKGVAGAGNIESDGICGEYTSLASGLPRVDCDDVTNQEVMQVEVPDKEPFSGERDSGALFDTDGLSLHDTNMEKTHGHSYVLGDSHGTNTEALLEDCDKMVQEVQCIKKLTSNAILEVSDAEKLEVVSNLKFERTDVHDMILRCNREGESTVRGGCFEGLRPIEDGVAQINELSKCPAHETDWTQSGESCHTKFQCSSSANNNTKESSNIKVLDSIYSKETMGYRGESKEASRGFQTETAAGPAREKHVEVSLGSVDAPVVGRGMDHSSNFTNKFSDVTDCKSIPTDNECLETLNVRIDTGQIMLVGLLDTKTDEASDTSQLKKSVSVEGLKRCTSKMDAKVADRTSEVLQGSDDLVAHSSKIKASDHEVDGISAQIICEMHAADVLPGACTGTIGSADAATLKSHNTDESHEFENQLDNSVCKTYDVSVGTVVADGADKKTDKGATVPKLKASDCKSDGVLTIVEHPEVSPSNLSNIDISRGIVDKSFDVTHTSDVEFGTGMSDLSGKLSDALASKIDDVIAVAEMGSHARADESIDASFMENPKITTESILMPDRCLLVHQKISACDNDEKKEPAVANAHGTQYTSVSKYPVVGAEEVCDSVNLEAPDSMTIKHQFHHHPDASVCIEKTACFDDLMVEVPHADDTDANKITHASSLVNQDIETVKPLEYNVHLEVLSCGTLGERSSTIFKGPVRNADVMDHYSRSEYSGPGANGLSCSCPEDPVRKADKIIDSANGVSSCHAFNVGHYKVLEGSVHEGDTMHTDDVISQDLNVALVEMTNDAKLDTHSNNNIPCFCATAEENLEAESDFADHFVDMGVVNNKNVARTAPWVHLKSPVEESVHVNTGCYDRSSDAAHDDAKDASVVVLDSEKHLEVSNCQTDSEKVPMEAFNTPGSDEHVEVPFCKSDGHVDEISKDSTEVGDMTGELDAHGNTSDLVSNTGELNSKQVDIDGERVYTVDGDTCVSSSVNSGRIAMMHLGAAREIPACKVNDVDIDNGMVISGLRRDKVPE